MNALEYFQQAEQVLESETAPTEKDLALATTYLLASIACTLATRRYFDRAEYTGVHPAHWDAHTDEVRVSPET
jgi:hypothetical protein